MNQRDLWLTRVFAGPDALGASVALVSASGVLPASFSALAGLLDADVVALVAAAPDGGGWTVVSCLGQRRTGDLSARLAAQAIPHPATSSTTWTPLESPPAAVSSPCSPLASVLGSAAPRRDPGVVVEAGGRWFLAEVESPAALQLLEVSRQQAWTYARHEGLDGLALYARTSTETLHLRAFRAADGGAEARATPEAVQALAPRLPDGRWKVLQGRGPADQRAILHLVLDGAPRLGGEVWLVGHGHLLAGAALPGRRAC